MLNIIQSDTIPFMTICIAGIAEEGKSIVLVTDKMLTGMNTVVPYQFEQDDVNKMYHFAETKIVLLAGTIQHAFAILENTKKKVGENTTKKLKDIVDELKKQYDLYRDSWLEEGILKPRGIKDLHEYYQNHAKYNSTLTQVIDQALVNSKFDVEFIIVGYEDNEWHIFHIVSGVQPQLKTTEGYSAIGTGGPHASYVIIDSEYSKKKSIKEIEKIIDDAKSKSEKSPGVGRGLNKEIYREEQKVYPIKN